MARSLNPEMKKQPAPYRPALRRSEVALVLSLATGMATGQSPEFAMQSCILARRIGLASGATQRDLDEAFNQALLRFIGCNADTRMMVGLLGDEILFRQKFALIDPANANELLPIVAQAVYAATAGQRGLGRAISVVKGLSTSRGTSVTVLSGHCEVAARLGSRLGLDGATCRNLSHLYVRWDGKGLPPGIKGAELSPAVRLVTLAQDALILRETYGESEMLSRLQKRRGGAYEPRLVEIVSSQCLGLFHAIEGVTWEDILALAPANDQLSDAEAEEALLAMADFVDLKLPCAPAHSRAVASLACAAAERLKLAPGDIRTLRWAALLHDLGNAAVPYPTLGKASALTAAEWEQLRLHPYHGHRMLLKVPAFSGVAGLVSQHHERLSGQGYPNGAAAAALSVAARILAAAETYQNRIEDRPHRKRFEPEAAARALLQEAEIGALDRTAVAAVLQVAGHVAALPPGLTQDELTPRERQVLSSIARGLTMKEAARELGLSPKTIDHHLQSIYAKFGVKTRAGAALMAVERGLVGATQT